MKICQRYFAVLAILKSLNRGAPSQKQQEEPLGVSKTKIFLGPFGSHRIVESGDVHQIFFPALNCAACLWIFDKILQKVEGIESYRINLETRTLRLKLRLSRASSLLESAPERLEESAKIIEEVICRLASAGYRGSPIAGDSNKTAQVIQMRRQLTDLGIAGAAFANVMLFSASVYFGGLDLEAKGMLFYFSLWSALLTTFSMVIPGRSLFRNSFFSVRSRVLHIDFPIVVALLVGWTVSIYHLSKGLNEVYFDSICGLIFFLLLGRYANDWLTGCHSIHAETFKRFDDW
ncbi:MAG: hypothetical protein NTV34_15965 [Proteobacteria bacterium]|nr:hypothetical protein [Pseudomonadota bacterium]